LKAEWDKLPWYGILFIFGLAIILLLVIYFEIKKRLKKWIHIKKITELKDKKIIPQEDFYKQRYNILVNSKVENCTNCGIALRPYLNGEFIDNTYFGKCKICGSKIFKI